MMLMRASLFGAEAEEVTTDADGAVKARKVKRAPNLTVALRLFLAYRDKVARIREKRGGQGARPDSREAVAQVDAMMAAIARKRAAAGG
ncbi:MAG: hypothetical protein DI606_14300 [Sphingobium sp.]|nr:MAG: hypothetical protein DI606_14300 [Sphingobium sp.]